MPSSGIITFQVPLRNSVVPRWLCPVSHGRSAAKVVCRNKNKPSSKWKIGWRWSSQMSYGSGNLAMVGSFVVKAVATTLPMEKNMPIVQQEEEDKHSIGSDRDLQSESIPLSLEETAEVVCRENERRMRISKANKGKVPWNKGRKHSPETIARIRERTRQAMQDPKVKEKLINCAHPQSEETRAKIGISVRREWKKRHEKWLVQETCFLEWKECIAEAARRGDDGDNELCWDDYEILKAKMHQEWLEAVTMLKAKAKAKAKEKGEHEDKRASKSADQRKKISEAIRAKWADPDYRQRVSLGMRNLYENRSPSARRRVVRKPVEKVGDKSLAADTMGKSRKYSRVVSSYRKKSPAPYADPFAGAKLERIKQARANREAIATKKREATERARLLIAEAEKAAKALESAAARDATAQASLSETRKLLAEAIQSMQRVEPTITASVLQRRPTTCVDAEALQSETKICPIALSAVHEPGDGNGTSYLSMFNDGNFPSEYDAGNSTVENSLNGNESQNAHEQHHSMEVGTPDFHNYVNSVFVNGKPRTDDAVVKLKGRHKENIGKETMLSSEANSEGPSMGAKCAAVAHKPTKEETVRARIAEAMPLQNIRKEIMLPVELDSIDSEGLAQTIAGRSEVRPVQMENNAILTSDKNIKKKWVCGRLIEVEDD